jgi:hypothetical protein
MHANYEHVEKQHGTEKWMDICANILLVGE